MLLLQAHSQTEIAKVLLQKNSQLSWEMLEADYGGRRGLYFQLRLDFLS